MATNDFLPFATNAAANVITQAEWVVDPAVVNGFAVGVADSDRLNKVWRQASFIASGIAQFTLQETGRDVLDDGDRVKFVAQFIEALGLATGAGGFVEEAPNTGIIYGRRSRAWWGPIIDQTALNNALLGYVKRIGDSMTGDLDMTGNDIINVVLDATNGDYLQIRRTATIGAVPVANTLREGELYIQMADTFPRLWCGVPTTVDATGRRLVADFGVATGYLPLSGGTLTGTLIMAPSAPATPQIVWQHPSLPVTTGGRWRINVGNSGFMNFQMNTVGDGGFTVANSVMSLDPNTNVHFLGGIYVSNNPNVALAVAANQTALVAPDATNFNTGAGIYIGSTAAGTTYHGNATHLFQNRNFSASYARFDANGTYLFGSLSVSNNPNPVLWQTGSGGWTYISAPDVLANNANGGIYLGSTTAGSTNSYRNTTHSFTDRPASYEFAKITSAGLRVVTGDARVAFGNIMAEAGQVYSNGSNAALNFMNRDNFGYSWLWYSTGNIARLYNAGDKFWVDTAGTLGTAGGVNASGSISTDGDFRLSRTYNVWGYLLRPNIAGYKNLCFATDGAGQLDNVWSYATLTRCTGGLSVGDSGTAQFTGDVNYMHLRTWDNQIAIWLGSSAMGNPSYYRAAVHYFQNRDGGQTFGQFDGNGITSSYTIRAQTLASNGDANIAGTIYSGGSYSYGNSYAAGEARASTLVSNANLHVAGTSYLNVVSAAGQIAGNPIISNGDLRAAGTSYLNAVSATGTITSNYRMELFAGSGVCLNTHGTVWLTSTQCYVAGGDIPLRIIADGGHYAMIHYAISGSGYAWNAGPDPGTPGVFAFGEEGSGIAWFGISVPYQRIASAVDVVASRYGYKPGGGVWADLSERRLKRDIEPFQRGLAEITKLKPVRYQFNAGAGFGPNAVKFGQGGDDEHTHTGLIAEDVAEIMPECIGNTRMPRHQGDVEGEEIMTLDATPVFYALVNSCRELAERVEVLEAQLKAAGG